MFSLAIQILSHLFLNSCALSAFIRDQNFLCVDLITTSLVGPRFLKSLSQ